MTYHALDIPEILSLIFEASDEAVLGQLAQCCKTFSNPALDVLWRMLPTPEPLRRLLPVKFDKYGVWCLYSYSRIPLIHCIAGTTSRCFHSRRSV